ncbi:Uncharacterised protein [Actinobacillus pleuropneumoniae]|nr:Uncharacterised protein [Actinobacillus pleuropneumoniae]
MKIKKRYIALLALGSVIGYALVSKLSMGTVDVKWLL